jgi:hypothetical protein
MVGNIHVIYTSRMHCIVLWVSTWPRRTTCKEGIYSCCTARMVFYATLTAQADTDSNQQPESSKIRHGTHSATWLGLISFDSIDLLFFYYATIWITSFHIATSCLTSFWHGQNFNYFFLSPFGASAAKTLACIALYIASERFCRTNTYLTYCVLPLRSLTCCWCRTLLLPRH